jgi:hypothetical protein
VTNFSNLFFGAGGTLSEVEEILWGIEGWEVLQAKDSSSEDGRPMWDVVARWRGSSF